MQKLFRVMIACGMSLLLFACAAANEDTANVSGAIELNWVLADNEVLAYSTAMEVVDDTQVQFDFGAVDDLNAEDVAETVAGFDMPQVGSMISVLNKNEQGNIDIKMIVHEVTFAEDSDGDPLGQMFNDFMEQMQGTVQLRGAVQPDGAVASFYNEQRQRNLIAMFFELPTSPVSVGDTWELDVNCVSMGATFVAERANRINQVTLTEITQNDEGQRVAVIDYLIIESVEGLFGMPFGDSESIPTSMTCSYLGRGYFLIDAGRWQQVIGEFTILSTGMMSTNITQRFALAPLENLPEEYRNLR